MRFYSRRGSMRSAKHEVGMPRRMHGPHPARVVPIRADYLDRSVSGEQWNSSRGGRSVVLAARDLGGPWWMQLLQGVGGGFVTLLDCGAASSDQVLVVSALSLCWAIPAQEP
jgi:hypothetical protein